MAASASALAVLECLGLTAEDIAALAADGAGPPDKTWVDTAADPAVCYLVTHECNDDGKFEPVVYSPKPDTSTGTYALGTPIDPAPDFTADGMVCGDDGLKLAACLVAAQAAGGGKRESN